MTRNQKSRFLIVIITIISLVIAIIIFAAVRKNSSAKSNSLGSISKKPTEKSDNDNSPSSITPAPNKNIKFVSTEVDDNTLKYYFVKQVERNKIAFSFSDFISALKREEQEFFSVFQRALSDASIKLSAYYWECPPVSAQTSNQNFEFVAIRSKELNNMKQDYSSFKEYLKDTSKEVHVFPSFGKDGILVIPSLRTAGDKTELDYKNISQFTQNASLKQQQSFWKKVAESLSKELEKTDRPRWLSTHGLGQGTAYLHVRIYDNPKYYHWKEYKKID